jgi:benzoate-CoA ligase family protein
VFVGSPPLAFTFGLGGLAVFPLRFGATATLLENASPANMIEIIETYKATISFTAPTAYRAMLAAMHNGANLSSLRAAVSAGETLPAPVFNDWVGKTGKPILDGIGSTEMLHIFISNRAGQVKYGTTGKPVPGYDVRLVDDDATVIKARGEIGELQVRGPTSAVMYWNNRAQSRATFLGEWTRSGDKYVEDEDGYFVYCGRHDDMLKVSGMYVSPFEVEAVLQSHPDVLEAAVVGWPDVDTLIKPKAFVVLNAPEKANNDLARTLQDYCRAKLAPFKYPRWIEFRAELPKTATGKIQRFKLRAEAPG